ncbi:DUF417 family protein [Mycobacterium kubicae]|uniref:DUF417 family protein n=1 Tax=Mycobacterium kubicae TaxID=120959 RepID=UPI001FCFD872|nr:DUF417 family protein [Mycobacterium kubicae]
MTTAVAVPTSRTVAGVLINIGHIVSRYGLVVVLAWIGFGKYVKMESRVLIEHSPLMSWVYQVASVPTVAHTLGTVEIVAAILIAAGPFSARLCAVGSAMAIVLFMGTLSFLFTTPGVIATHAAGVPVLSGMPGQFLLKDLVLIGVSFWSCGEALARRQRPTSASQPQGVESNSMTLPAPDGAGKAPSSKP